MKIGRLIEYSLRNIFIQKLSRVWDYNPGNNILALFNNLAQVRIATSKTILDIKHNQLAARVASRVAGRAYVPTQEKKKRLTILGNKEY